MPPEAAEYQLTCKPAVATTVKAGMVAPSQIAGLLGVVGAATGGQLQLGAFTVVWLVQLAAEVAVILIFEPAGIRLIVKPPPLGAIVPAVAVRLAAFEVITTV
jgi:hypothetical protein